MNWKLPLLAAGIATSLGIGAFANEDWGYGATNGPDNWANMSSDWEACATGGTQSPINIEGTEPAITHRLEPFYRVTPLDLKNSHHTIRADYAPGSFLKVGNKLYALLQFHFHTPSEHTVMGNSAPMEIHFVHRNADGTLAVIGVMVTEGEANAAAEEIWPNLPLEPEQGTNMPSVKINARDLMPFDLSYYRYTGSLTTPPCDEGVSWYVMKNSVSFSAEQIAAIRGIMGENARPTQPRNNRIIIDGQPE